MAELRLVNAAGTAIVVDGTNTDQVEFLNNRGFRSADAPRRGRKPKQDSADNDSADSVTAE